MSESYKSADHLDTLFKWEPDPRIVELVAHTCLYKYKTAIRKKTQLSGTLTKLLYDSYNRNNCCFDFKEVKLFFGLKDIFYITGLPIKGDLLVASDVNTRDLSRDLLGFEVAALDVELLDLKNRFEVIEQDAGEERLMRAARGYLLYLIGCVISPLHPSRLHVPLVFLNFVSEMTTVNNYAWGAGLLASIHSGLGKAKKACKDMVFAPLLPAHVFAIVRLSAFARYYSLPDPDNLHFPLVGNVVSLISVAGRKLDARSVLENTELNVLSPYDSVRRFVPEVMRRSQESFFDFEGYIVFYNKVWYLSQNDRTKRRRAEMGKTRKGEPRDWTVKYAAEIAIWNQALEEISNYSQKPVDPPHFSPPTVPAKRVRTRRPEAERLVEDLNSGYRAPRRERMLKVPQKFGDCSVLNRMHRTRESREEQH